MSGKKGLLQAEEKVLGLVATGRGLICVDFDGTISEIVGDPLIAAPYPGAKEALARLNAVADIAVMSGRPVVWLKEALSGLPLTYVGNHGLQWSDGPEVLDITAPEEAAALAVVREALRESGSSGDLADVKLEDKITSLAIHYRNAPSPMDKRQWLLDLAGRLVAEAPLVVGEGRFVVEIRPAGAGKGKALARLASRPGISWVLYAGDDITDIEAFEALTALDGLPGVSIAVQSEEAGRELWRRADYVADSVSELVGWLSRLADALESGG